MLIQGSSNSNRTNILIEYYNELLEQNVSASKILVLTQNAYKKTQFIENFKNTTKIQFYENPKIYTFNGFVYNTIIENWPLIENITTTGKTVITPYLTGLEISEIFFKSAVNEIGFKDYNSKINLIHQLFRRYSLISNNNLSNKEVESRSKQLGETFANDAHLAIETYKRKSLEFRAFDYIRQLGIFKYIIDNTNYLKNIEHLIIDDADEVTPFIFDFLKKIHPSLKSIYIGYDRFGTSRLGFLNADIKTVELIENTFKNEKTINCDNINYFPIKTVHTECSRRLEMINESLLLIIKLIQSGVNPSEIAIITPINDILLNNTITETLEKKGIQVQKLSGNEKLISTPLVKSTIDLLKISLGEKISKTEFRNILKSILKLPVKYCVNIINTYNCTEEIKPDENTFELHKETINNFSNTIKKISNPELTLSEKIFIIQREIATLDKEDLSQINALSFFIKQIQDFEEVFGEYKTDKRFLKTILTQFENSIISENASNSSDIKKDAIIVSTVQKFIDYSIKTKYQFWLDTTSNEWTKDDLGTIYNAWVLQKSWDKSEFTYEDNILLTKTKVRKQLRKLAILTQKIYSYSSYWDIEGNENICGIKDYLEKENINPKILNKYQFIPREDQQEILEYQKGKLAISAVPGAGKTTVLLALIIKLLNQNVKSENIFVLTYMDSAAKNFKERIKKELPNLEQMPNISTIHGLALRILKENANHTKVGLDTNFEICDDNTRQKTIREAIAKLQLEQDEYDKYEKAISILKLSNTEKCRYNKDQEISKFLKLYEQYNKMLKTQNLIDYDDMLYLCVNLLENNKDIANYYQQICHYIIEDEAQDSSEIQQTLIQILSNKHKNLIRCGDINQSITTTFTNTNLAGFKNYVKETKTITMNQSQRCAKEIYEMANNLIDFSQKNKTLKDTFYDIKMKAVAGKNPISPNAVVLSKFDEYKQEQEYILQEIKTIFRKNEHASIAILVRNNYNIETYASFLTEQGYKIITKNDTLNEQPIFRLMHKILKFYNHPWNNDYVYEIANTLSTQNLIHFTNAELSKIKESKTPFILQNETTLKSKELIQLNWDLNYWLETTVNDIETFIFKIGNYYYHSEIEKSNISLIALLFKNLYSQYKNLELVIEKLDDISNQQILSKYKFFGEKEQTQQEKETIQIMTYHKSKGDEFDYVFIPQLTEESLPFDINNIKIKSKERFLESIKALNSKYKKKNEIELKKFIAEENLRILYVAITRAKKKLYITSAKKYKKFSKIKEAIPSIIFDSKDFLTGENNHNE